MATEVAGELKESITVKLLEVARQIRQKSGYAFDPEELNDHLQLVVEGEFPKNANTARIKFQNLPFGDDWKKKGWKSEKDPVIQEGEVTLELISFCNKDESISGGKLEKKAKELGCYDLGLAHAEQLLENQEIIPKSWRKHYLVFAGSVWLDSSSNRGVPCLCWDGTRWCLGFDWFRIDFRSSGRFVRPCK